MKFARPYRKVSIVLLGLLFPLMLAAAETSADDSWPDEDSESRAAQVNEGELNFIAPVHDQSILHSDTHLWLSAESRQSGWVKMRQCYRQLDAIGKTDVVYAYREMKNLRVIRTKKIARVRVKPQRVELENVEKDAELCVEAEVKIFQRLSDSTFAVHNGPYHRRFLDGYYPYRVSLTVHYADDEMQLEQIAPEPQAGFYLTKNPGELNIDSWFEGELRIMLVFTER